MGLIGKTICIGLGIISVLIIAIIIFILFVWIVDLFERKFKKG